MSREPHRRGGRIRWAGRSLLLAAAACLASRAAFGQELGNLVSPGPLSRAHANLEGLKNCEKCHTPGKMVTAEKCLVCHQPIAERMTARRGVHRDVKGDCVTCHVEHAGADADLRPIDIKGFNHAEETGFSLDGKHAAIATQCAKCHTTRSFLAAKPECVTCHQDPHRGTLGVSCQSCHSATVAFKETRTTFDHGKAAFALTGAHLRVACEKCHANNVFKGLKFGVCADCHASPHGRQTVFLSPCASCHSTDTWKTDKLDHARTGFALLGKHATARCESCHVQPAAKVKLQFDACARCHQDPHRGKFKEDCASCHNESSFGAGKFDHATRTTFPLTGRHVTTPCAKCHTNVALQGSRPARTVEFAKVDRACAACHADPHAGKLGADCASCHTTDEFRVATFRHPRLPEFFAGAHAAVPCAKCHVDGAVQPAALKAPPASGRIYRGLSTDCATCHKDVHLGQLGAQCQTCHSVAAAKFAAPGFTHAGTNFQLTGKHAQAACATCHKQESGVFPAGAGTAVRFSGTARECDSCHRDVHTGRFGPRCQDCHSAATFAVTAFTHKNSPGLFVGKHASTDCKSCHKPAAGEPPSANGLGLRFAGFTAACASCHEDAHRGALGNRCESCHAPDRPFASASRAFHKATLFPLEGNHLKVACASCHLQGVLKGTPTACYDCHWIRRQDDRFATRLGTQCEQCHSPTGWRPALWDHAALTGFALSSSHRGLACESCHAGGVFRSNLSPECIGCHRSDFERASNPNHVTSGFPTTCTTCHRGVDTSWRGATFDHAASFALVGTHATRPCESCHVQGVYHGTPRDCAGCHLPDYQRTTSPNHAAAGFPTACETCHRPTDQSWTQVPFDHARTFPLVGVHASRACRDCHINNVYHGTPRDCVGCHLTRYQQTTNPNHAAAGFSTACETCHHATDTSWQGVRFTHRSFQLQGVHATRVCRDCHGSNVFAGTPTACVSCHLQAYQQATSPNHVTAGFPTACESCHRASDPSWRGATFDHNTTFPLVGVHATRACQDCHINNVYHGTPRDCVGCHLTRYQQTTNPNHAAAGFSTACETCHHATDTSWQGVRFTHRSFQLQGVHATRVCRDCHGSNVFAGTPTACVSCHLQAYQQATSPNHVTAGFPTACESCHRASDPSWRGATFDHNTTFPLVGVHATRACQDCHINNVYHGTPRDCVGCHLTRYQQTTNPNHAAAGFSTACETCHHATDTSWQGVRFTHRSFQLQGVHATRVCRDCHGSNVFAGTPTACVSCHLQAYQQATSPNHVTAGFPTACESCHRASDPSWRGATFDHNTTFPLVGVHATRACQDCHINNVYHGTPRDCVGCHLTRYQQTTNPNHVAAGFPTTCETCHHATDTSWNQGHFDHNTTFPLVGVHATRACQDCHINNVYHGTPRDCVGCHLTRYQQTTNPNHVAAGFPTTCETCHHATDTSWNQGHFDHNTTFPLVGVHATRACQDCHINNVYHGTPRDCVGCHLTRYQQTTNPNHVAAGFPTTCETCHHATDTSWNQGHFDHNTTFPLVGVHATRACQDCHINNVYHGTPRDCVGCHLTRYQQTTNPNHVAAGFPTTCETCHHATDTSWNQGHFDHNTTFPLVGVHATRACQDCHINNVYHGTPRDCVGCHLTRYQQTTNPNHVAAGFPTTCETCHRATDTTWNQGTYSHSVWPLLGAHASPNCTTCHVNNVYNGLSSECVSCHLQAYQQATNPNHVTAGFPTTCQTCHRVSDTSWSQGTFSHTWFPITSGHHANRLCRDCHPNQSTFTVFTCTTSCHPRSETDGHHHGVNGYVYESAACYSCHPNGRS